jgi:hypothetical protein
MSLSDFLEVEHTEVQAEVSFGALIVTAELTFLDVLADVIFLTNP